MFKEAISSLLNSLKSNKKFTAIMIFALAGSALIANYKSTTVDEGCYLTDASPVVIMGEVEGRVMGLVLVPPGFFFPAEIDMSLFGKFNPRKVKCTELMLDGI